MLSGLGAQRGNRYKRVLNSCFRIWPEKLRETVQMSFPIHPSFIFSPPSEHTSEGQTEEVWECTEPSCSGLSYNVMVHLYRLAMLWHFLSTNCSNSIGIQARKEGQGVPLKKLLLDRAMTSLVANGMKAALLLMIWVGVVHFVALWEHILEIKQSYTKQTLIQCKELQSKYVPSNIQKCLALFNHSVFRGVCLVAAC
jgi:hypothetical protein